MNAGDSLTRGTIWLALGCAAAMAVEAMLCQQRPRDERLARWLWTLGCAAYLGHVLAAFHFYHHWSHAAASRETARQTTETIGITWAGGIYFNYLFTALWLADVVWWWANP